MEEKYAVFSMTKKKNEVHSPSYYIKTLSVPLGMAFNTSTCFVLPDNPPLCPIRYFL